MTNASRTIWTIFLCLLLDLLAFTLILPLFPSIFEHYRTHNDWFYVACTRSITRFRQYVGAPEHYDFVLFGGFLGSIYSFLQFVSSPVLGALSDRFGRKPILLLCTVGLAISYLLWALSSTMIYFVIARIIGGLSKGNVCLCMAAITDVSNERDRGKGMALVGIAFSLGFVFGPLIGATFVTWARHSVTDWFVYPAMLSLFLIVLDFLLIYVWFDESLTPANRSRSLDVWNKARSFIAVNDLFTFKALRAANARELMHLHALAVVYFVYLFIFSGLEFTLTFLLHSHFDFDSMQQGKLYFVTGVIMMVLQGGVVRRLPVKRTRVAACFGLWTIIPSYLLVALAHTYKSMTFLYAGVVVYSVSTAFVVSCLTTLVSRCGDVQEKGLTMGIFRSIGALARAVGPVTASICFWCFGATFTYTLGAVLLVYPAWKLQRHRGLEDDGVRARSD